MLKREDYDRFDEDQENRLQVHDVAVSYASPYPCDFDTEAYLTIALESIKGASQFAEMKEIICKNSSSQIVFMNLFWLFFSLRFQPAAFSDVLVSLYLKLHTNL